MYKPLTFFSTFLSFGFLKHSCCCDRKSRAACAQSFAPWQQGTIEITRRDHSIIACSRHACIFSIFAHIPFVVNHTINATPPERLQQHPLLFTTNHTDRTFFVWRLTLARPSHPGHSTMLLGSEILSGMCSKLRTVAAINNRDHSIIACSGHIHIFCSSRTSRSWWITQSTQHHRRGCNTTQAVTGGRQFSTWTMV